jgi:RimJ/RimL family protein N-acetyltransferase
MTDADRVALHPLDRAGLQAVVDADGTGRRWHPEFPLQDDRDAARMTLKHADPVFGCYTVVERASGLTVGTIGFFGPPDPAGVAMVGYGLVPSARGAGYATEALRALVAVAFAQPGVRRLEADPLPGNTASHRVLEKAGFVHTRSTEDARWYGMDRPA